MPSDKKNNNLKHLAGSLLRAKETGILIPLLVMIIALSIFAKNFLTSDNIFSLMRAACFEGIVAIGMLIVILTGGLDLSVASNMAFIGILSSLFVVKLGMPTILAILISIIVGGFIGLVNGFFINKLHLGAIIVTLGMMSVVRGLGYIITKGLPITGLPESYTYLGQGLIGGFFPVPIVFFIGIAVIVHIILKKTVIGYHIFAIGGNETASSYSGINVEKVRYISYAMCGALAGLGGVLLIGRLGVAQPSIAVGYELTIIAAVIIGGASLNGGEGSVLGSVIGILIIAVIRNGLVLMDIGGYYIQFTNGLLILTAVVINRLRNIKREYE